MKQLLCILFAAGLIFTSGSLSAQQKTYKAVCDKTDGKVKIVESEDSSPNMVPLKGGFPFYQVAEKWVRENYPDGSCDPVAATKQNQAAADAVTRAVTTLQPAATGQKAPTTTGQNTTPTKQAVAPTAGQPALALRAPRYRNTSMNVSFLFSDLGKAYGVDPPLIPGVSIGIDQVIGTKFYGGIGISFNALIGKTSDNADISAFYTVRIPLFAGYRMTKGTRQWGVDIGVAANTKLSPLPSDAGMGGETASDASFNMLTRAKIGNERRTFEIGADLWLNDILTSYEGYQMMALTLGYRFYF